MCVSINPDKDQCWIIDDRIYDPARAGKRNRDPVRERLDNALPDKHLPLRGGLMDSWDAERTLMWPLERLNKVYSCPLKATRHVDETGGARGYGYSPAGKHQRVDSLTGPEPEVQHGTTLHLKDVPQGHPVKLFRLVRSAKRTACSATNAFAQDSTQATQQGGGVRWQIAPFHRETKQTTGSAGGPCRWARLQRHPSAWAMLVWLRLKQIAQESAAPLYPLKQRLRDADLRSQLRSPAIQMQFA
jgi:hypothetical protein